MEVTWSRTGGTSVPEAFALMLSPQQLDSELLESVQCVSYRAFCLGQFSGFVASEWACCEEESGTGSHLCWLRGLQLQDSHGSVRVKGRM